MAFKELLLDAYSALSHKAPFRDRVRGKIDGFEPWTWTGEEHLRRLTAYIVLAAYDSNVARLFLDAGVDDRDQRREYGDAALVIDQVLAHLLGEDQEILVPGAEDYDPELTEPVRRTPAEGEDPADVDAEFEDALAAWEVNLEAAELAEAQDFLREWADAEHLALKMLTVERNAVRDGDGVYLLGWSEEKQRPTCAQVEPGFYFPVLPDSLDENDYPETVHIAWQIPGEDYEDGKDRVRRLSYRLTDLTQTSAYVPDDGEGGVLLPEGATWRNAASPDEPAELVRDYPWNGEPSPMVCTLTDATWILDNLNDASNVDAFTLSAAGTVIAETDDGTLIEDLDLGIDFIPVVHVPNTPAGQDHYGQSSLAKVLQVLDDLQSVDTDVQAASATTGTPVLGIEGNPSGDSPLTGRRGRNVELKPGLVLDGKLTALDTSNQLKELREEVKDLRDRLATNARLPGVVLGTVTPSEAPSGFAMLIGYGPLGSMIRQMRLVRSVKHPLVLKFAYRLFQANELRDAGSTPRAEVQLGSFLPQDRAGVLELVTGGVGAGVISLETGVTMLVEAGFPIEDVAEEIGRIQARDFEGANTLADATGDGAGVRDYLGLEPAEPGTGPPLDLGGGGG